MHRTEDEHHYANLATDCFKHFANICGSDGLLQCQGDVTDVYKVKTDDKEVINGVGQPFVTPKRVYQKKRARSYAASVLPTP